MSKTITLRPRAGNPPPRLWEAPAGLINSIGLPNKGLARYLAEDLAELATLPAPLITNVMGASAEELVELVAACDERPQIAAIELNVSCPNVKTGLDIGSDPRLLAEVVGAVRARTVKPLIVKLTPNTDDVAGCAAAAAGRGRRCGLADQHPARARARAAHARRRVAAVARGRHRRPVRARHPGGRARAGGDGG